MPRVDCAEIEAVAGPQFGDSRAVARTVIRHPDIGSVESQKSGCSHGTCAGPDAGSIAGPQLGYIAARLAVLFGKTDQHCVVTNVRTRKSFHKAFTKRFLMRCPASVVILPVVDFNVPLTLALAW